MESSSIVLIEKTEQKPEVKNIKTNAILKPHKMSFQTKVHNHMATYKKDVLKIQAAGTYNYKGNSGPRDHILPVEQKEYNILQKYRVSCIKYMSMQEITLHPCFHHLNSSQAMCINFFYPLMKKKRLGAVLSLLGIPGEPVYDSVCFEKESELEGDSRRKTNFDFYMETSEGEKVFFEIKYTEGDFAKNMRDSEHVKKFHKTYSGLVNESLALREDVKNEASFLRNYQVMRNLVHIDADSYVVFIYPEGNKVIGNSAYTAKTVMLKDTWKDHLILFTWENLLREVERHPDLAGFGDYFTKDFTEKYII